MSPAVLSISVKNDVRISVPIFYFSNMGNSTQLIYLFEYPQQKYIVPWVFQVWFNYFNLDRSQNLPNLSILGFSAFELNTEIFGNCWEISIFWFDFSLTQTFCLQEYR